MSGVTLPESVSDACGTREIRLDRARTARVRPGRERQARFLLEHVEHGLQRDDRAIVDGTVAFLDPADRGPERDAELAHLALFLEVGERRPEVVVEDRLDPRVVQLVEVDVVDAEPAQRVFALLRAPTPAASRAAVPTARGTCVPR